MHCQNSCHEEFDVLLMESTSNQRLPRLASQRTLVGKAYAWQDSKLLSSCRSRITPICRSPAIPSPRPAKMSRQAELLKAHLILREFLSIADNAGCELEV